MDISEYDAIGFDIDHTLCRYKVDEQIKVGYYGMVDFLVTVKGYPKELEKPLEEDAQFCYAGGLMYDVRRSVFMKICKNGKILKASCGLRMLTDDEIIKIYPDRMCEFIDNMKNGVYSQAGEYHYYENNFDITGIVLISRMVEFTNKTPQVIWNDLVASIEYAWHPIGFKNHTGGYFPAIKTQPEKYLHKTSQKVLEWIASLKEKGKFMFLVTSAHCDCASHVLDYCLGEGWKKYFDIIISHAGKPKFFFERAPFLGVDTETWHETTHISHLKHHGWYSKGNATHLTKTISRILNNENPSILYFGDSLRSDIVPPTLTSKPWETIYIQEELGDLHKHNPKVANLLLSDIWGEIFAPNVHKQTFYEYSIRKHAKIAIACLDDIAEHPIDQKYALLAAHGDNGFYPKLSKI